MLKGCPKLNDEQKKVLLVLLCAFVIVVLLSFLEPDYGQICNTAKGQKPPNCPSYNVIAYAFWRFIGVADDYGAAITALATVFLGIITYLLVRLGNRQAKTSEAQLRAYLSVRVGSAVFQDANLRFEGVPSVINIGQTPAYRVRSWIAADIIATQNAATYDFDRARPANWGESQASIGPTEERTIRRAVEARVPDEDVLDIKEGTKAALWVWGEISYHDAFGNPHLVRFSQRLFWNGLGRVLGQYGERFVFYD